MKKIIFFFLCIVFFKISSAQISITEVYYDTPANEFIYDPNFYRYDNHHLGEFIELYNYTTEAISLDGWFLSDNYGAFHFPKGITIPPDNFLIVAFKEDKDEAYFTRFFPTTKGKESKIIYQNKLLLNNYDDAVRLYGVRNGKIHGEQNMPEKVVLIDVMSWADPEYRKLGKSKERHLYAAKHDNYDPLTATNPNYNYYTKSLQKQLGYTRTANPLEAIYKPETEEYTDIMHPYYRENYAYLTWAEYAKKILYNSCPVSIPIIKQTPSYTATSSTLCFIHDTAGNLITGTDCQSAVSSRLLKSSEDELEWIKNKIQVYPNPTSTLVKISWDGDVAGSIDHMKITSLATGYFLPVPTSSGDYAAEVDLTYQPNGIYILTVVLKSGKNFTKNIIKL